MNEDLATQRWVERHPANLARFMGLRVSPFHAAIYDAALAGKAWPTEWLRDAHAAWSALALHPRYGAFSEGIVSLDHVAYFAALPLVAMAVTRFSFDLRRVGL